MDKDLDQIKREGNAFDRGLGVGRALGPDGTIDLRMRCLAQANETAKLGLSRDVYETAERYYRWAVGEKPELRAELPYKTALISLMEAEILGERTDLEKLREETAECFGIVEDRHWPPVNPKPLVMGDREDAEAQARAVDRHFVVRKPDGTIADRADFERLEREAEARSLDATYARVDVHPGWDAAVGREIQPAALGELQRDLDEISDRIVQPITDSLEASRAQDVECWFKGTAA